jgi:hypothetical protein
MEHLLEGTPVEQAGERIEPARLSDASGECRDLSPLVKNQDEQAKRPDGKDEQWGHFTSVIGC